MESPIANTRIVTKKNKFAMFLTERKKRQIALFDVSDKDRLLNLVFSSPQEIIRERGCRYNCKDQ